MSASVDEITLSQTQEEAVRKVLQDAASDFAKAVELWLGRTVRAEAKNIRAMDQDQARLVLPSDATGYLVDLSDELDPVIAMLEPGLMKALASAVAVGPEEDIDPESAETGEDFLNHLGSLVGLALFERGLVQAREDELAVPVTHRALESSSWAGGDDPLGAHERYLVLNSAITFDDVSHPCIHLVPWSYAGRLFAIGGEAPDAKEKAGGARGGTVPSVGGGGARSAAGQAGLNGGSQASDEPYIAPDSIAALTAEEDEIPLPSTPAPVIALSDLHSYRPKKIAPIRYARGHQMRQTREAAPVLLVGSRALLPTLTGAYEDRDVFHLNDNEELLARLADDDSPPQAIVLHIPAGHEAWLASGVAVQKFRDQLESIPVLVVLDDPSPQNVNFCARYGLVNIMPATAPARQVTDLVSTALD